MYFLSRLSHYCTVLRLLSPLDRCVYPPPVTGSHSVARSKPLSASRQGVERVASAAASLTAAGSDLLPRHALRLLSAARQDAVALCEAMARLDELLAARERAQLARRRALEEEDEEGGRGGAGGMMSSYGGGGGNEGQRPRR